MADADEDAIVAADNVPNVDVDLSDETQDFRFLTALR